LRLRRWKWKTFVWRRAVEDDDDASRKIFSPAKTEFSSLSIFSFLFSSVSIHFIFIVLSIFYRLSCAPLWHLS
jgi:hypothetical protein